MDPTQKIACFVVDAAYEKISSEALEAAKTAFLDCRESPWQGVKKTLQGFALCWLEKRGREASPP